MSPNAAADQDALYYLYLNGEWAGPYQVGQIRTQVEQGQVATDSYAYDASQQRHFTVEELLAAPAPHESETPVSQSGSITQGMSALFDDVVDMAPQSSASFDAVLPDLKVFYIAYLGLTEHTAEPQQALNDLHGAHHGLIQELDRRRAETNTLARVINEIDEVADYLANRHQISQLWSLLSELEKVDIAGAPDEAVACARAVLASLTGRAEAESGTGSGSGTGTSSVLLDLAGLEDDADSVITRKILLSARSEVASAKRDMDVLQQTYNELQEQHAKDLDKARRLLEKAEAARAEERHTARQTAAEVRNLAAEIQRLANEADLTGGEDQELAQQIVLLGEELRTAEASTLAYIAEDVLIRMVAQLRHLAASSGGDSAPLRIELARARENLAQAQTQVLQLTSERDTLRLQYEQSCQAAEKASERAKDREHRLRSTVTALEVTKELHQEVMEDLKVQLHSAQGRVEQMERDLASVRGEMKDTTGTVEARGKAIQHEMQRMVEMKAMLEVRSNELSANLKSAEDELAKAQSSDQDTSLAEALAAKVTQLRTTYEVTTQRLQDQEAIAERLSGELEVSRREAAELRGRSDQLSGELSDARGSLSAAKHRLDELHQAYARLDAERQALHTELHHRKSTDIIHKGGDAGEHASERLSRLEHESALLQRQLASEKRQAEQSAEIRKGLESRVVEITNERAELQRKVEFLQNEHFNDHSRHTAAIAVSTQAAIESERRLRELQGRVADLEAQLRQARKSSEVDGLEPTTARVAGHSNALENAEQHGLRAELEQVARERDQVLAQLATIRTAQVVPPGPSEVPEAVAKRLTALERELTAATASIAALDERHAQAAAERDRLRRDFERVRNERESAAVEHRTALKSARDRLTESQERVAELERQLGDRAVSDSDGLVLRNHLDQSLSEQERLSKEVQRLAAELARLNASVPADRDQQLIGLAKASHQLASEQERVRVLNRSLMETLQQADSVRGRVLELESLLDQRTSERDHLQQQLDRQRAKLADLRLGLDDGTVADSEVRSGVARRDQTIADLDQVRKDLAETRARLTTTHRADSALEGLSKEQARIRELERELAALHGETEQRQQMFNEARARLVQVSSERDRLAAEVAELRSRPDQEVELKMLRRRLIRAKRLIKRLRRERDAAIAERQKSATNLHELTGQIERLKGAQRAAAEALGLSAAVLPGEASAHGDSSHGSRIAIGLGSGGFAELSSVQRAVDIPPGRQVPKALTRRIMPSQAAKQPGLGFTSAFGRPMIPFAGGAAPAPGMESAHSMPSQTHVTAVLAAKPHATPPWHRRLIRHPLALATTGLFTLAAGALVLLPPLVPLATQAVVNAPVTMVAATIPGQFDASSLNAGARIERGQILGVIRNDHVDTSTLKGLIANRDNARAKFTDLIELSADTERAIAALTQQVERYRAGLITDLDQRITSERVELARRDSALGLTADQATLPGAKAAVESQRALIDTLGRRLASLRAGQFDPDDLPVAQTRAEEATTRLANLAQQRRTLDLGISELDTAIGEEEAKVAALRRATVTAAVPGVLWSRQASDRQSVTIGAELLRIADPQQIEVEALLHERYRDDVQMDAIVEIIAPGDRRIRGNLSQGLALGSHTKVDRAVNLTAAAPGYDKLYITLDPLAAPLPIGQKVAVVVLGQQPGWFTRTLAWFYETTRL